MHVASRERERERRESKDGGDRGRVKGVRNNACVGDCNRYVSPKQNETAQPTLDTN